MGCSHFHAMGGNVQRGSLNVKLRPLRAGRLTGANKGECHEFDCESRNVLPRIDLDCAQKRWKLFGIDTREVRFPGRLENIPWTNFRRRVPARMSVCDCVAETLARRLQSPLCKPLMFRGLRAFLGLYWKTSEGSLAERGGFEPPVELLTLQRFSKPPPSATRPSLLLARIIPEAALCLLRPR